jgi:hypothetical protein
MEIHSDRIVQYVVGSVEKEVEKHPSNFVERRVVLCARDEMTAQANDSRVKSWVFEDQHSLCVMFLLDVCPTWTRGVA